MIRPPKLRITIRCTQHFQHLGLTWLTQWTNLTSLWYGQFSLSLGKALTFPLHSYTLKWGPVRAGAQLVRVNSDKRHSLETATLEQKWRQTTQSRWVETVTAIWLPPQYIKELLVLKFRLGTYVTLLKPWFGLLKILWPLKNISPAAYFRNFTVFWVFLLDDGLLKVRRCSIWRC